MEKDFDNNNENCIEFLSGEHYAVATLLCSVYRKIKKK